jgi:hypothetical protein
MIEQVPGLATVLIRRGICIVDVPWRTLRFLSLSAIALQSICYLINVPFQSSSKLLLPLITMSIDIHHRKCASKKDCRLINVVMLVAGSCQRSRIFLRASPISCTHLNVPTPPASNNRFGLSLTSLPVHLAAKALNICPWATIKTSPGGASFLLFPIAGL